MGTATATRPPVLTPSDLDYLDDSSPQFAEAIRRILDEGSAVDPQSTCARFNSSF